MTTLPFRTHDQVPAAISSTLFRGLVAEWVALHQLPSTGTALRGWASAEPVLTGHERPCELLEVIDAAPPAQADALLLALIRLTQGGHQLAGRIVLHAMLPKLAQMAAATRPTGTLDASAEDRRHIAVAELWHVIATYRAGRRPARVAANLAMDTLHRLTAPGRAVGAVEIPTAPELLPHVAAADDDTPGELSPHTNLAGLLGWAIEHDVITREDAGLLRLVYTPDAGVSGPRSDAAAHQLGLTPAAVRQRCARTRRRLAAAVQADAQAADTISDQPRRR